MGNVTRTLFSHYKFFLYTAAKFNMKFKLMKFMFYKNFWLYLKDGNGKILGGIPSKLILRKKLSKNFIFIIAMYSKFNCHSEFELKNNISVVS